MPLEQLNHPPFQAQTAITGPAFYRASFEVSDQRDTFLALPGWTRGVCWVNGFNLGRYWRRGPQQTLYVPGSLLKAGENELILFELHEAGDRALEFRAQPELAQG